MLKKLSILIFVPTAFGTLLYLVATSTIGDSTGRSGISDAIAGAIAIFFTFVLMVVIAIDQFLRKKK
jgi:hypothetical protein